MAGTVNEKTIVLEAADSISATAIRLWPACVQGSWADLKERIAAELMETICDGKAWSVRISCSEFGMTKFPSDPSDPPGGRMLTVRAEVTPLEG